jgi:two-component system, chemotaxis family, sensor kinase CheA
LTGDPELRALLVTELERHLGDLVGSPIHREAAQRALHALKGSAGLANERELSSAFQRLERRLREGDLEAAAAAAELVRVAKDRLSRGASATAVEWPEPPGDLIPKAIDGAMRDPYVAESRDRLAGIDAALASREDVDEAARMIRRHIHTMKGAASSVGDEGMTWFCHGLEDRLRLVDPSGASGSLVIEELSRWRGVLAALLDDPVAALEALRAVGTRTTRPPTSRPSPRSTEEPHRGGEEGTIRVATSSVDRLLDRLEAIGLARERVAAKIETAREQSRELRRLRGDLADALRLIGPPRPWGAPAAALRRIEWTAKALASLGDELDHAANDLRSGDLLLRDSVTESRAQVAAMRQTPLWRTFGRISTAIEAEARRSGRAVIVRTEGADQAIDRLIAERLLEPCLQLARNAVAHGIEPPDVRAACKKSETGTISISAKRVGNRLSIAIADDGAGVDVAAVRERAVASGAVAPAVAEAADDNTLLALLFLPGFSTRKTSDLLAGRGIGLDIALSTVRRLGGVIRLSSRPGQGFTARVEIAVESELANVLWVTVGGEQYALPAAQARTVSKMTGDGIPTPHLASCLETRASGLAAYAIELDDGEPGKSPARVGVDEVSRTEEVLIRPLSPLVSGIGPFAGGIARGDGSLRLALDVYALAPIARTLGRLPEGRASDRPPPSRPPPACPAVPAMSPGRLRA